MYCFQATVYGDYLQQRLKTNNRKLQGRYCYLRGRGQNEGVTETMQKQTRNLDKNIVCIIFLSPLSPHPFNIVLEVLV